MLKNKRSGLRALTVGAMMAALSIILERVIALMPASNMLDFRVSLSNVPIILAGVLVSPLMGGICGVVSDIVGCFISGYAPFPLLTVAPFLMGLLPAVFLKMTGAAALRPPFVKVLVSVVAAHLFASVLVTTYGLCVMRGVGFVPMLLTRLWSCAANTAIDTCLVYLLLKTDAVRKI